MNSYAYVVVRTARTEAEASRVIEALLSAGFQPADLDPNSRHSASDEEAAYQIEVPTGEAAAAKEFLMSYRDPESEF